MSRPRRNGAIGASTAALVLAIGIGVAVLGPVSQAAPRTGPVPASAVGPAPSAGVLANSGAFALHPVPGDVGVAPAPLSVRYSFDAGIDQPIRGDDGGHELRPIGQNGGSLALVPSDAGLAVEYPQRCTLFRERECPRAILEGTRDDNLNPGLRPMTYGASIQMSHTDLADGANVLQKGYSVGGVSQFKLQVDHRLGHPSCVIAAYRGRIYRAEPALDVADGRWHDVACSRTEDRLSIIVDGLERAAVPIPPGLSIANAEPLRVGGKGPNRGNDQYAGRLDNVYLTIF